MSAWELPTTATVGGIEYEIRSDYRAVLDILAAFMDPELPEQWKTLVMIKIMFPGWENISQEHLQEAADKAAEFIDAGMAGDEKSPRLMDWEQDAGILVPAINRVAGQEIRALPYLHWWTFLGYYMEIGESIFSQVLAIRKKKIKKKKLEKWESDFYRENKKIIDLKKKETRSEEEQKELRALFGIKKIEGRR